MWHISELAGKRTNHVQAVRGTVRTTVYTVRAPSGLTARLCFTGAQLVAFSDQMSSPGDYLPVRVGLAFGIAPCGELWAKEFGGGAEVRAAFAYKMAAYTLILLKKSR